MKARKRCTNLVTGKHLATCLFFALAGTTATPQSVFRLFDGSDTIQWVPASTGSGPIAWTVEDGALAVTPGSGGIETFQHFQDFELHVEFLSPPTPEGTPEQSRGNSGVYLQKRYEIQILDSYNWPLSGFNDCAAIYNLRDADTNVARPAGEWQTYDIQFRAARWNGTTKLEQARVSITWNGTLVHSNVAIPGLTGGGLPESSAPGPVFLQDHGDLVRFSNLWIRPINPVIPSAPQGLAALADNDDVRLFWSSVPGRASYNVRRAADASGPFTMIARYVQTPSFADVAPGDGPWYYTVSAVSEGVEGSESAPVLATATALIAYEPFPYKPGGNLAGQGSWFSTAGQESTFKVDSGNLDVPGLALSQNNRIIWPLTPASSVRLTNGVTTSSGSIYFSFAYRVDNLGNLPAGGAGSTVAAFVQNFTTASYTTKLDVRKDIGGEGYNIGVFKTNGETVGGFDTNILSLSNTVFVVGRYTYGGAAADDTCALWVNPGPATFGTTNAPVPSVGDIGVGGTDFPPIVGFAFRTSGGPSLSYADELRVGLTWADVTPPLVTTPNLTIALNADSTITIAWPAAAIGFNLESTPALSPSAWVPVTNSPTVVGTNNTATVNFGSGNQFFRLKK